MKEFSLSEPSPYDLKTYIGRVLHFIRFVNPVNALHTSESIRKCQKLIQDYVDKKNTEPISNEELWKARYVVISNLNPDSGQEIPRLFRLSAFVPTNIPIVIGLAISPPTTFNIAFWQIINQSYNFGINVANANASNAAANYGELTAAYVAAISSSIGVAFGINSLIKKVNVRDSLKVHVLRVGPFFGTITASAVNLAFARYKDLTEGIYLRDEKTNERTEQRSTEAGFVSFFQCCVSRVLIPAPVFIVPALATSWFRKMGKYPTTKGGELLFNTVVASLVLWGALPLSIGVFPQEGRIHKSKLEPQFQNLVNSKGQPIEYFVFNRGL